MTDFWDVSSAQEGVLPDPVASHHGGATLGAIKATEGTGYAWTAGGEFANACRAAGLQVVRYHFLTTVSGDAQAAWFLQHCDKRDVTCLDLEWQPSGPGYRAWRAGEAKLVWGSAAARIESARGPGIVYVAAAFIREHQIPYRHGWHWWQPDYTDPVDPAPAGWPQPWARQYSDRGRLPGMKAPGDVSHLLVATPQPPARPYPWGQPPGDIASPVRWMAPTDGNEPGWRDVHRLPTNAAQVYTPAGARMGFVISPPLGFRDLHDVGPGAAVQGFRWTRGGWQQAA